MPPGENSTEDKLDAILFHLERLDRRDRLRTIGAFFRSIITIVPVLLLLWASWYFAQHSQEIMTQIATITAQQAAKYSQQQSASMLEQVKNMLPQR